MLNDQLGDAAQEALTLVRIDARPAVEGPTGGVYGEVYVFAAAPGQLGEQLARGRVEGGEGLPGERGAGLVLDADHGLPRAADGAKVARWGA